MWKRWMIKSPSKVIIETYELELTGSQVEYDKMKSRERKEFILEKIFSFLISILLTILLTYVIYR